MRNYEDVVGLLCDSLNGYAYESLDKADAKRFDKAYQAGDEEAFCHLFGPKHILDHIGEFLGYFMVRKVMGSQELLRSAGTVTKNSPRGSRNRVTSATTNERSPSTGGPRQRVISPAPSASPASSTTRAVLRRTSIPVLWATETSSRTTS